jgi:excisionase family DNA binding protein
VTEQRRFLTTGEVARRLHVSPGTILRWVHDGHLQAIQTPRWFDARFDPDVIAELEARLRGEEREGA